MLNQKSISYRKEREERNKTLSESVMMNQWGVVRLRFKRFIEATISVESTGEGKVISSSFNGIVSTYTEPVEVEEMSVGKESPALTADSPQQTRHEPFSYPKPLEL